MKTKLCSLLAAALLGGLPVSRAAEQKFDLAGVEVTLPGNGWDIREVKSAPQKINFDNGGFDSRRIDRRLLVRRSDTGKALAVLLVTGSLGEPTAVRFRETSCPKVAADRYYVHRMALREDEPPQCALIGGPFDGPRTLRSMLEQWHLTLAETDPRPPDSVWHVVAFATNMRGARFTVAGVVSDDAFDGLPEKQPLADSPPRVPLAVAAWADAMGAAMQRALDGFGSHKTTFPPMTFTPAAAPR